MKQYNGDTTLDHWIRREVCPIKFVPNSRYFSIFINTQTNSNASRYHNSSQIDCFQQVFNHRITTDKKQLRKLININKENLLYKKILILINATKIKFKNDEKFLWFISLVDALDNNCWNCLPPIITIDQNFTKKRLIQLSNRFISSTNKTFTSIIHHHSSSTTVHIRPTLDGCYRNSSTFIPNTLKHFERLQISYKKCNFNQAELRITSRGQQPFCQIVQYNNSYRQFGSSFGLESILIKFLAKRFNFRYKLIDPIFWGIAYENGKWNGNIGQVYSRVCT